MSVNSSDISFRKVLLVACLPLGGTDVVDGYTHRVRSMAQSLCNFELKVCILWFFRIQDFFALRKLKVESLDFEECYRPVLPFYFDHSLGLFSRIIAACWIEEVRRKFPFEIIQAETSLHGAISSYFSGNRKIVVDFHGDLLAEMNMNKQCKWKLALAAKDEKRALTNSTAVLSASQALIEVLQERNNLKINLSAVAPCGVNLDRFADALCHRDKQRKSLELGGRIVFCYLGGLQRWQNIEETISLFKNIFRHDKRAFLMIITNSDTRECREQLSEIGEPGGNYLFFSLTSEEVPIYLPLADFGFLLRGDNAVNRVASPTKFGEYLAAGLPVITSPYAGDASQITSDTGCGFIYSYDNLDMLLTYISESMSNRIQLFHHCRTVAMKSQSWHVSELALRSIYRTILSEPSAHTDSKGTMS